MAPQETEKREIKKGPLNRQITDTLLMIRPDAFGFNEETAASNEFQNVPTESSDVVRGRAIAEFETMVLQLQHEGIHVVVIPSRDNTPDAVFPNNWLSFHDNGTAVLYPMLAPNRRAERQFDTAMSALSGFVNRNEIQVVDLTHLEDEGKFLEGTGSLVFDRRNGVAFAVESPRTTLAALKVFCDELDMKPVVFHATGTEGKPIYHTNVVMGIGDGFSVVCIEAIEDSNERANVILHLEKNGAIVPISKDQMDAFCGNIMHVQSIDGKKKIIMSQAARDAFTDDQKEILKNFGDLVAVSIPTIESVGGGSARCMVAEVFSPVVTTR